MKKKHVNKIILFILVASLISAVACGKRQENDSVTEERQNDSTMDEQEEKADVKRESIWGNAFAYVDHKNNLYLWQQFGEEPILLTNSFISMTAEMMTDYTDEDYYEIQDNSNIDLTHSAAVYAKDKEGIYYLSDVGMRSFGGLKMVADLYYYARTGEQTLVADHIAGYQLDAEGNVWYSRISEGKETSVYLYCYDGKEHWEAGEMKGPEAADFKVSKDSSYAIFWGKDGLYGVERHKTPERLLEATEGELYLSPDGKRCVCRSEDKVYVKDIGENGKSKVIDIEGENYVYLPDENAETILIMETRQTSYAELLKDDVAGNQEAEKIWQEWKDEKIEYHIKRGRLKQYDAISGQTVLLEEGYLLEGIGYTQMEPINGYFCFEMIPLKTFRKIPISEFIYPDTVDDMVSDYSYYEKNIFDGYGDGIWYDQAKAFIVNGTQLKELPEIALSGQWKTRSTYNKEKEIFYIRVQREYEWVETYMDGLPSVGEDVYAVDREGNCKKVAEAVAQALVKGDTLYYVRGMGDGRSRLYSLEEEGYLLEADEINLDQMRKTETTGNIFLLLGNSGAADPFLGRLNYYDGNECKELAQNISRFTLYGDDCVVALQGESGFNGFGNQADYEKLLIFEDGEEKVLNDKVYMLIPIQE